MAKIGEVHVFSISWRGIIEQQNHNPNQIKIALEKYDPKLGWCLVGSYYGPESKQGWRLKEHVFSNIHDKEAINARQCAERLYLDFSK